MLDEAVKNILRVKVKMGLFEHPYIDAAAVSNRVDFAAGRRLAREAAAKCCVLLKNEKATLPLGKKTKIALIGDLSAADEEMKGCWQSWWTNYENASLKSAFASRGIDFVYEQCYSLTGACDRAAIRRVAEKADVVVAAFGEYAEHYPFSGENTSRVKLELTDGQLEAIDEIAKCGKPFVAVLFNGRPLPVPELAAKADAILEAWHPGGVGGMGVSDVLFGDCEPYGRLTVDIPRATGQCPIYYNRTSTGRPYKPNEYWVTKWSDCEFSPLYPFGYGLTYTSFAYAKEKVEKTGGGGEEALVFSCEVTNTGKRTGSEVVQVYVRDLVAPVVRPVRELKGYKRVTLAPGETRRVEIRVPVSALGFHQNGKFVPARGRFAAWIAPDSVSGKRLVLTREDNVLK